MNNSWNKVIYRFWAPIYDVFFNSGPFLQARKKIFANLGIKPDSQILFVGVGTGADLRFMMGKDVSVIAIDLSPEMLDKAKKKYDSPNFTFMEMDAQALTYSPGSFDMVIGNLILSVVPDPDQCFQEMIRVTRTEGCILIFDKFCLPLPLRNCPQLRNPSPRLSNDGDGRHFEHIIKPYESHIRVVEDVPALYNDMYRKILLRKIHG